jgi:hypothetical protein
MDDFPCKRHDFVSAFNIGNKRATVFEVQDFSAFVPAIACQQVNGVFGSHRLWCVEIDDIEHQDADTGRFSKQCAALEVFGGPVFR